MVFWSLISLLFGLSCALILDVFLPNTSYTLSILLAALVCFGAYIIPKGPEARIGYSMALFVGIMGHLSNAPFTEAIVRSSVFIGALFLGIGISWILFPTKAHEIAQNKIIDSMRLHQELLLIVFHYILRIENNEALIKKWPEKQFLKQLTNIRNALMENNQTLYQETNQHVPESFQFTLYNLSRILNYLSGLIQVAQIARQNVLVQEYHSELLSLCLYITHALRIWSLRLEQHHSLLTLPQCQTLHEAIHKKIKTTDLNTFNLEPLIVFLSLYHELHSFAEDLTAILVEQELPQKRSAYTIEKDAFILP
jgi:hypothetical protein